MRWHIGEVSVLREKGPQPPVRALPVFLAARLRKL
jgi:hypothetical protein